MTIVKNGSVSVAKALADHEVWHLDPFSRGQAWMDLLLLANDANRTFLAGGRPVQVFRGQLGWSLKSLARRWRWSDEKTAGFMLWIERAGMVSRQSNGVTTILTVTNYETYNPTDAKPDTEPAAVADTGKATGTTSGPDGVSAANPATGTEQKVEVGSKEEGNTHGAGGVKRILAEAIAYGSGLQPAPIPKEAVEDWWNRKVNSLDHGFSTVRDWRLDLVTWWRRIGKEWNPVRKKNGVPKKPVRFAVPVLNPL